MGKQAGCAAAKASAQLATALPPQLATALLHVEGHESCQPLPHLRQLTAAAKACSASASIAGSSGHSATRRRAYASWAPAAAWKSLRAMWKSAKTCRKPTECLIKLQLEQLQGQTEGICHLPDGIWQAARQVLPAHLERLGRGPQVQLGRPPLQRSNDLRVGDDGGKYAHGMR